jgi:hypothetical protein
MREQQQMGLGFDPLDAAFAQPVTQPMPPRRGRPRRAVAVAAVPAVDAVPLQTAPGSTSTSSLASSSAHLSEAALSAEDMARALEAHPDYRVLRRLVPTTDFGTSAGVSAASSLRTLLVLDTETTGLDATRDKVIELALLKVSVDTLTGQPVGAVQVYDGLEDPGYAGAASHHRHHRHHHGDGAGVSVLTRRVWPSCCRAWIWWWHTTRGLTGRLSKGGCPHLRSCPGCAHGPMSIGKPWAKAAPSSRAWPWPVAGFTTRTAPRPTAMPCWLCWRNP